MQLKIYKDQIMCRNNGPATEHVSRIDKSFDFKRLYKIHKSHLFDQNMNHTNYILLKKPSLTTFSGILNGGCAPICADISSKKKISSYACYPFSEVKQKSLHDGEKAMQQPQAGMEQQVASVGWRDVLCGKMKQRGLLWATWNHTGQEHHTCQVCVSWCAQCGRKKFLQVPSQRSFPQRNLQWQGKQF